jgi:hypothetical protein
MPIATGIVRDAQVGAGFAALDMTAQRPHGMNPWAEGPRSAALDRRHDLELPEAHMAGMRGTPSRPAVPEDVRHLDPHGTSPWLKAHGRDNGRASAFAGRQVHDANIVETMLEHGERRILTFNEADFRRFAELIEIVTPQERIKPITRRPLPDDYA